MQNRILLVPVSFRLSLFSQVCFSIAYCVNCNFWRSFIDNNSHDKQRQKVRTV